MNPLSAIRAEYGDVWAIAPNMLERIAGLDLSAAPLKSKVPRMPSFKGSVGVLPLMGIITQRGGGMLSMFMDVTSTDVYGQEFDRMMADDSVGAILMDVSSPGGTSYGVAELGEKIREARGTKPIIAVANSMAASAGYWIASQADKLYVTPGGDVGSIGVYILHMDESEALAEEGVKPTFISAGKFKVEGNPFEPLTDEAREQLQAMADRCYDMFAGAVAKGRGVTPRAVKANYGEGRLVGAQEAVKDGMADGVASFEEVLTGLVSKSKGRQRAAATAGTIGDVTPDGGIILPADVSKAIIDSQKGDRPVIASQGAALEMPADPEPEEEETPRRDEAEDRIRRARLA